MELYTIGHSNHSIETLIGLLKQHDIAALADVRSHPYSRYLPHFNQASLKSSLQTAGIQYVFLGQELGARPSDPECYIEGKALYEKIAATELFAQGIQRLLKGAERYKIALMCAEKDPITCHRAILVCPHLRSLNLPIQHILKDGSLESHEQLESRLLKLHGLENFEASKPLQLSLFSLEEPSNIPLKQRSREELLQEAYQKQGEQIAYVEKSQSHNE
ncbi:DUF488 domain-containing protein [Geitlerinema splendidum]|nr:DUF488 domain-containing protein [Geitlerinema splendidum]